jgi:outer membrane protein
LQKLGVILAGIFLLTMAGCNSEPAKFGVVDVAKVVNSSKAGQKANAEIEALVKAKQAEINDKGAAIQKLEKGLKEHPPKGKPDDLSRASAEYQKLAMTAEAEVKKKAQELRLAFFEQIRKIIQTVGEEEKFLMIFTSENVPYYQKATDVTEKVIKKVDGAAEGN